MMKQEEIDSVVEELIACLESDIRDTARVGISKERYFEHFVTFYNGELMTPDTLRDILYKNWIKNRIKLLEEVIDSWGDWTLAWENIDKKRL